MKKSFVAVLGCWLMCVAVACQAQVWTNAPPPVTPPGWTNNTTPPPPWYATVQHSGVVVGVYSNLQFGLRGTQELTRIIGNVAGAATNGVNAVVNTTNAAGVASLVSNILYIGTNGVGGGSGSITNNRVGAGSSSRLSITNGSGPEAVFNFDASGLATGTPLYVQSETNASARLLSNVWAAADSTTNYALRTSTGTYVRTTDTRGMTNSGGVVLTGPVTLGGANVVTAQHGFAAGLLTTASGNNGANANGYATTASGAEGANANGVNNTASGNEGANANGIGNTVSGNEGANANGAGNTASGNNGANANGAGNTASGANGANANGSGNVASGGAAFANGSANTAAGAISTALGYAALATNDYTFVWGDGTGPGGGNYIGSRTSHTFTVQASNGVYLLGGPLYANAIGLTNLPIYVNGGSVAQTPTGAVITVSGGGSITNILAGNGVAVTSGSGPQVTVALSNGFTLAGGITITAGAFTGNGSGLTNVNARTLDGFTGSDITSNTVKIVATPPFSAVTTSAGGTNTTTISATLRMYQPRDSKGDLDIGWTDSLVTGVDLVSAHNATNDIIFARYATTPSTTTKTNTYYFYSPFGITGVVTGLVRASQASGVFVFTARDGNNASAAITQTVAAADTTYTTNLPLAITALYFSVEARIQTTNSANLYQAGVDLR